MKISHFLVLSVLVPVCSGCVYPFEPKGVDEKKFILVVEGDIIANGTTVIQISRSFGIDETIADMALERNALVVVESSTGVVYPATETTPGIYEADTDNIDLSARYRLCISTRDNIAYASEYVPVCISPPVDSVSYLVNEAEQCVNIYVSTHDPGNKTHFYRWTFEQDWEFHSVYTAVIYFDVTTGTYQYFTDDWYSPYTFCWNRHNSSGIYVDNSIKFTQDRIDNKPIVSINASDQRISYLYCIRVIQRALTVDGYEYWSNLNKYGEDLGGIFAPMPNELRGNIRCLSDPDQPVLGFVSATTCTYSDRTFIDDPFNDQNRTVFMACDNEVVVSGSVPPGLLSAHMTFLLSTKLPYMETTSPGSAYWAPRRCVDCTMHGTKNKPSWWPNDHH